MKNNSNHIEDYLYKALERLKMLDAEVPCQENTIAIARIEDALMWLEHRADDRKARGVSGTKEA